MGYSKFHIFFPLFIVLFINFDTANAQVKEVAQYATLTPAVFLISSNEIIPAHKHHFTLSAISYLGLFQITDSKWKAAAITLFIGMGKELIYDELLGKGSLDIHDMKWNALGVTQGIVFTASLKF